MEKIPYYVGDPTSAPIDSILGATYVKTKAKEEAAIVLIRSSLFIFEDFPLCRAVVRLGTNTENIPTDEANARGIKIFYAPGANASSVAQMVMAISLGRNMIAAHERTKEIMIVAEAQQGLENEKKKFLGNLLTAETNVGIIGAGGNIGRLLPNYFFPYGVNIYGHDLPEVLQKLDAPSVRKTELCEEIATTCNIITSHVSGHQEVLTKKTLSLLQPETLLIDFARGDSFNIDGVRQQIMQKNIKFHTDFCTVPALQLQRDYPGNCFCYPHIGGLTGYAEASCATTALTALRTYDETGQLDLKLCKNASAFTEVTA